MESDIFYTQNVSSALAGVLVFRARTTLQMDADVLRDKLGSKFSLGGINDPHVIPYPAKRPQSSGPYGTLGSEQRV